MLPLLLAAALALQGPVPFPTAAIAELRTGWRFTIGDNPAWARPGHADTNWRQAAVPGTWQEDGFPNYRGFVWYRLRYRLDSTAAMPMGIRFTGVATAYEVFADGRLLGGVGRFPPQYRARTTVPVSFALPAGALTRGEHVLAVRVYSDERIGGIDNPVLAGPLEALAAREFGTSFLLIAAALLIIGISFYQLFFWARRPEATEHLYLFLFGTALGLVFLVWVPPLRLALSAGIDYYRLYLLGGGIASGFFLFAFRLIFDLEHSRLVNGFGFFFSALGALALVLPGWGELRAAGMYVFNPSLLVACVVIVVLAVRQFQRGVEHAKVLLWGMAFLAVALVHDVFGEWGLTPVRLGLPWMSFGAAVFVLSIGYVTARQFVDRAAIALYDRLTGLARREVVMDALHREIRRAARTHQPLSVIMMDLDNFKLVNDSLGHQAGDRVLAEVGRRLATAGRAVDWLGRYGGEEFLAVLADSGLDGAELAGERFCQAVGALPIDTGRVTRAVTLSAGIAAYDGGAQWPTPEQLVGAADAALYRAKAGGKNQVHA
jgi:diguanylate cyclase (GGDEF)-like protein